MDEERMQVLQMLGEGKITAEQAGELLDALGLGTAPAASRTAARPAAPPRPRGGEHRGHPAAVNQLLAARMHGVTPEYIADMHNAGLGGLTLQQLVEARMFGVTVKYLEGIRDEGLTDLSFKQICELAMHGVQPEFIREMREAGFVDLGADELTEMRIHGTPPPTAPAPVAPAAPEVER